MKNFKNILVALSALLVLPQCTTMQSPTAKTNSVIGGVLGAAAGAGIGEHKGRELEGAAIGGVLGAIAGNTIGSAQDDINRQRAGATTHAPAYYGRGYQQQQGYPQQRYHQNYHRPQSQYQQPQYRSTPLPNPQQQQGYYRGY